MSLRGGLWPLGVAYRGVTGIRNWAYDKKIRASEKVSAKVISVGNVTVGGTGKTPTVLWLIEQIEKRKSSVGVVSRGYKRLEKGVMEVDTSIRAATRFGDEPALIKVTFPKVPVFVGEKRVAAAKALLESQKVDVLLCDDAFQHRALARDLNIVLMDVTEPRENYQILPLGRAREALLPALKRADVLIATKANLVAPEDLKEWMEWVKGISDLPLVRADYEFKGYFTATGEALGDLRDPVILVSGIAKPAAFVKSLEGRAHILQHKTFPDHHRYTDLEIEILLDEASSSGARWILTTPKDAMKLRPFPRLKERLVVAELGLKMSGEVKALYEALDRLTR